MDFNLKTLFIATSRILAEKKHFHEENETGDFIKDGRLKEVVVKSCSHRHPPSSPSGRLGLPSRRRGGGSGAGSQASQV